MFLVTATLLFTSCKKDAIKSSVITEVYEVTAGSTNEYAKGPLKFMEHETFREDRLIQKMYYNQDQTVKGKEIFTFEKGKELPIGSKFYAPDGSLLSTYKYEYQDTLKSFSYAYEGDSDELLRIEGFQYDPKGNMVRKSIFNDKMVVQRSFLFGHDKYGNEIKMVMTDEKDQQMLSETYEIVTVDENNDWIEKYGYLNDSKYPVTFYHKRKSELGN